jgi:hypothetical protein
MEGEKQVALLTEEQKGCTCTNAVNKCPNGRHSMNLISKSKPRLFRGDWEGWGGGVGVKGPKDEIKKLGNHFGIFLISMIMPLMKSHTTLKK